MLATRRKQPSLEFSGYAMATNPGSQRVTEAEATLALAEYLERALDKGESTPGA
jgi:hypothetical protein